jgi:hypothetical protein
LRQGGHTWTQTCPSDTHLRALSDTLAMLIHSKNLGGQQTDKTTLPVHATPAYVAGQDPEFLDAKGVEARFSIRRSLLYELLNGGHIKSVSLRRRGQSRGKRLFDVNSIRQFLSAQMEGGR